MATLSTKSRIYVCHFCANEYLNRATLLSHLSQCQINNSIKLLDASVIFQLNQFQQDCLHMVQLRSLKTSISSSTKILEKSSVNLDIPLTHLYSHDYLSSSLQSSFDDSLCNPDPSSLTVEAADLSLNNNFNNEEALVKLSSYHIYKYSRREQKLFNSRLKNRSPMEKSPLTINGHHHHQKIKTYFINIPTKIYSRQRFISHTTLIYPLLFSPNFRTLVQYPSNPLFQTYFHLLHSIASQEFHYIVEKSHYQNDYSSQTLSLMNILRKTIYDYEKTTLKRDYEDDGIEDEVENGHELSIPPLKIRRHDDSSYEIDKRSTSSSSSGMSITQISNGHSSDDRRRLETRFKKTSSKISDIQFNSNSNDSSECPLQNEIDYQQYKDRTSSNQSNDSLPKYQSVVLNEGARIRIVNCSNDSNKQSSSIRPPSLVNSADKLDENWTKTSRINTRKISSTNLKTSDPTYQAQSVLLSNDEIAKQWLTHNVFYRCHACSHEEFFVVFSRECMRLHVSSKHGNMEENFKQRLSNFLNNKGRALKIFQHYLKWQQPWSEKEIDQIFQLANMNSKTNGAV